MLRLTPVSSATQTLIESAVCISPTPLRLLVGQGPFGETTRTIILDRPHDQLVIEARSRVDVHAPERLPSAAPAWEAVRVAAFGTRQLGADGPAAYLYPTRRTPCVGAITDYARASFLAGRPIIEAACDLMVRIHRDFTYDPDTTTVSTPAIEAFEARSGVCQDFAHIMIAGLRGLGLPAAYVSGYLRTNPPPGRPRLEGADATHAWIALWCGESGWIGLDPTNAVPALNDHVVLATGRDYSDVAPIDGIILAPGKQAIKVEVDVVPEAD
ncbi:transglutaminase [Polymorphobacter multimanifer]|nr:transglutaminase family protein [Polymorphobacter multimanifer]GGI86480.1 transglutaminase [Polymorphobacter multimanifer]